MILLTPVNLILVPYISQKHITLNLIVLNIAEKNGKHCDYIWLNIVNHTVVLACVYWPLFLPKIFLCIFNLIIYFSLYFNNVNYFYSKFKKKGRKCCWWTKKKSSGRGIVWLYTRVPDFMRINPTSGRQIHKNWPSIATDLQVNW